MAVTTPSLQLIDALRETARRLKSGADYNWCHMGRCNCGHLAQTITSFSPAEIHEMALMKAGDWTNQTIEHCTSTGYTIDHIIQTMLGLGLTRQDIVNLERLGDQRVLTRIPLECRKRMDHKNRADVVLYMETFASLLEDQLLEDVSPALNRSIININKGLGIEVNEQSPKTSQKTIAFETADA